MLHSASKRLTLALALLLAVAVARLWVEQIGASFWADEMVTAFVVHHGAADPSLAVAPQVPKSAYYDVTRAADRLFSANEIAYRLPSILFSLLTLWLIARLAMRLIDPEAGWFAAFACFAFKEFNWEAADARPYAMGFCALAAAAWFLIRWLDTGQARHALAFLFFGALIWRIQLIFWPVYVVLILYAFVRLARHETPVTWIGAIAVFGALGVTLIPVLLDAIAINRGAGDHVIAAQPTARQLFKAIGWKLPAWSVGASFLVARLSRWTRERPPFSVSAMLLIGGWWLIPPVALFAFSLITGNSVFVRRYYSIGLPGAALAATFLAGLFLPKPHWRQAAGVLGVAILLIYGVRLESWPGSNWRSAAAAVNALPADTPVVAPSPFIEAKPPDWRPDYPLPGFLYTHLDIYPLRQHALLLPFQPSVAATDYASRITPMLAKSGRFAIYGGDTNVRFWRNWFAGEPQFFTWNFRDLGRFGDVEVVVFEAPR